MGFSFAPESQAAMSMTPTELVDTRLAATLRDTLDRLRSARADGPPDHNQATCKGPCRICATERSLNRLLEKMPRQENP